MTSRALIGILCIAFIIPPIGGFYIPGVAPLDFRKDENVEVKVNDQRVSDVIQRQGLVFFSSQAVKMTSTKTQLPYDYYDVAVHCKPLNGTKYKSENLGKISKDLRSGRRAFLLFLGEILRGDRIVNTKFQVMSLFYFTGNGQDTDWMLGWNGRQRSLSNAV